MDDQEYKNLEIGLDNLDMNKDSFIGKKLIDKKYLSEEEVGIEKKKKRSFCQEIRVLIDIALRELQSRKLNNIISVSTVVLLLVFIGLINSLMGMSPLIYLMMSEKHLGEQDIIFYNSNLLSLLNNESKMEDIKEIFIDFKEIRENYCQKYLQGCVSRFQVKGEVSINGEDIVTDVMLIDIEAEQHAHLGRKVQLEELGEEECYVGKSLYRFLENEQQNKNGDYKMVLELSAQLLLNMLPMFSSDSKLRSNEIKLHYFSNMMFEYLRVANIDYESADDLLLVFIKSASLPSELVSALSKSFNFTEFLQIKYDDEDNTKIKRQYRICLYIVDFALTSKGDLQLKTKGFIPDNSGKFPDSFSNIVILDFVKQRDWIINSICESFISNILVRVKEQSFLTYIALTVSKGQLVEQIKQLAKQQLSKEFFDEKAYQVLGIIKDKPTSYSTEKQISKMVESYSNKFSDEFGVIYPTRLMFSLALPQGENLKQKQILDNSYDAGIMLLIALSSVIIYSVTQSSIHQQVQEYGIVRIIGSSVSSLLLYSLFKSFFFYMIPALAISELMNYFTLKIISNYFCDLLAFTDSPPLYSSTSYYLTTIILGVGLPLFCNLLPFKTFLDKQVLSQALHAHSRVLNQTKVIVQKLEKYGITLYALINSIILITVGILSYYFAPYAFVTQNMGLFLMIVNLTFLMVNMGIGFILNLFQRQIEIGFIRLLLSTIQKGDKNLQLVIENNFKNNENRMKKVGMIIMMIFSFYISIGSSVNSQVLLIKNIVKLNVGSDFLLQSTSRDLMLDQFSISQQLEGFKKRNPNIIQGYSFISQPISTIQGFNSLAKVYNFAGETAKWNLISISPSFFDSIYSELFIPDIPLFEGHNPSNSLYFSNNQSSIGCYKEYDTIKSKDQFLVQSLFWNEGQVNFERLIEHQYEQAIRIYVSTKDRKFMSFDYNIHMDLILGYTLYKLIAGGFGQKIPGVKQFTDNSVAQFLESGSIAFISEDQYEHILNTSWKIMGLKDEEIQTFINSYPPNSTHNIPKNKLFVKLRSDIPISVEQRIELKDILKPNQDSASQSSEDGQQQQHAIELLDTQLIIESLEYLIKFWNIVFYFISIFIFILTYYLLTITFKQNLLENIHNIKIYKALGLNHRQILKIFIYEGFSVMMVNGTLGVLVGICLSVMIQSQLVVFLEMPMNLNSISYGMTLVLLLMCILMSIFASKKEIDSIKSLSISEINH